jgi:hypothetical protein
MIPSDDLFFCDFQAIATIVRDGGDAGRSHERRFDDEGYRIQGYEGRICTFYVIINKYGLLLIFVRELLFLLYYCSFLPLTHIPLRRLFLCHHPS